MENLLEPSVVGTADGSTAGKNRRVVRLKGEIAMIVNFLTSRVVRFGGEAVHQERLKKCAIFMVLEIGLKSKCANVLIEVTYGGHFDPPEYV
eukprot:scaffold927_cov310-Pavlova_lutheri.AAC.7